MILQLAYKIIWGLILAAVMTLTGCVEVIADPAGIPNPLPLPDYTAWSPDGKVIAFSPQYDSEIYTVAVQLEENTQTPQLLTGSNSSSEWNPSWSPDGKVILYVSERGQNDDLYLLDLNTGREQPLVADTDGTGLPAWSPTGEEVAYTRQDKHGTYFVEVVNVLTGESKRLTTGYEPIFSPDGQQIAFVREDGIYIIKRDGSDLRQVVPSDPTTGRSVGQPRWSPAGEQLLFTSLSMSGDIGEIHVANIDGSGRRNLSNHPALDYWPDWSPDGEFIVFTSERAGNSEIYRIRPDGSELTRLTFTPGDEYHPLWSPDGRFIAFWLHQPGTRTRELRLMAPDGSNTQLLLSMEERNEGVFFR